MDRTDRARAAKRTVYAVLFATALAFATSLQAGFVWDDALLIEHNRALTGPDAFAHAWTHGFWDLGAGGRETLVAVYWRPLVTLLFVALRHFFGLHALPYHLAVLVLHLVAVALAGRLARRLCDDDPVATLVSVVPFALHATRSQSVTWIVGATDVMAAIPMLVALDAMLPTRDDTTARRVAIRGAISSISCALALCAKEAALVLPALIALVYVVSRDEPRRVRAGVLAAVPSACVVALYLAMRAVWLPFGAAPSSPPFVRHALLVAETLGRYAGVVVWPFPLTFFRTVLDVDGAGQVRTHVGWALCGLVVVALWVATLRRTRNPRIAAGLAIAAVTLAPVANVRWMAFPDLLADRFLYLPMLGLGIALGAAVRERGERARRLAVLVCLGLGLVHGAAIALRALDFHDERTLWRAEGELRPGVPVILVHAAAADVADGRHGAALLQMREAFAQSSHYALETRVARDMYAAFDVALLVVPDDDRASLESALAFVDALEDPHATTARATVLGSTFALPKRGLDAWLRADASRFETSRASLLSRLGRDDEARDAVERAIARCTADCADVLLNGALVDARARAWDRAQTLASRAHALDPDDRAASGLGPRLVLARAHDDGDALDEAEVDLFLASPERARNRLVTVPPSPRAQLLAARIALLEFRFADAAAILEPLMANAPASARPEFEALAALETVQRRKAAGLERVLARQGARSTQLNERLVAPLHSSLAWQRVDAHAHDGVPAHAAGAVAHSYDELSTQHAFGPHETVPSGHTPPSTNCCAPPVVRCRTQS